MLLSVTYKAIYIRVFQKRKRRWLFFRSPNSKLNAFVVRCYLIGTNFFNRIAAEAFRRGITIANEAVSKKPHRLLRNSCYVVGAHIEELIESSANIIAANDQQHRVWLDGWIGELRNRSFTIYWCDYSSAAHSSDWYGDTNS